MAGYYDPNKDYSQAIMDAQNSGASQDVIDQLQEERQNKIDSVYGGNEPNMWGSDKTFSETYGGSSGSYGSGSSPQKGPGYVTGGYDTGIMGSPILNTNPYYNPVGGGNKNRQPDMSRRPDLAGQYATSNGFTVFYDENGYAVRSSQGAADMRPTQDWYVQNGTYNGGNLWTDEEMLTPEDLKRVESIRTQLKAGQLTGDQANQLANQIRAGYGYAIDKEGYLTDLGAINRINERRQAWGLPVYGYANSGSGTGGAGSIGTLPGGGVSGGSIGSLSRYDSSAMKDMLGAWLQQAQQQQQQQIDYQVSQSVNELRRAQEDANSQFQTMRNQVDIDEARAKDNQALYAQARGDKGGIGAAQYDSVMNAAAQNRLAVNQQQTKLATDTARQIADLRAQGEFEKADALLELSQQYLSQLMSLEQWAAEYNLSVDQFNIGLQQWQQEFNASIDQWNKQYGLSLDQWNFEKNQATQQQLASAGEALLSSGILPSSSQLSAMGMTVDQAKSFLSALKLSKTVSGSSSRSSSGSKSSSSGSGTKITANLGTDAWYQQIQSAASAAGQDVADYLNQHYKDLNLTSGLASDYAEKYAEWAANRTNWPGQGSNLPSYDAILQNSQSGKYGKKFGLVLSQVQIMATRDNRTQDEVSQYLLDELKAGNITQDGVAAIMQALGI